MMVHSPGNGSSIGQTHGRFANTASSTGTHVVGVLGSGIHGGYNDTPQRGMMGMRPTSMTTGM
jgi:hypothetical protein